MNINYIIGVLYIILGVMVFSGAAAMFLLRLAIALFGLILITKGLQKCGVPLHASRIYGYSHRFSQWTGRIYNQWR